MDRVGLRGGVCTRVCVCVQACRCLLYDIPKGILVDIMAPRSLRRPNVFIQSAVDGVGC